MIVPGPTACLCCSGGRLRKLGEDVTEMLASIPRQWKVPLNRQPERYAKECVPLGCRPSLIRWVRARQC
jgi:transposase